VYVDDIAAAAESRDQLNWFFDKLNARFDAKNLGEIKKILGIRVTRDRKARILELDQEQYLDKVLNKFKFKHAKEKEITTPIDRYNDIQPASKHDERIDPI
jgi:Reverse transcriptase (RNA-dependent DNA polymerase)